MLKKRAVKRILTLRFQVLGLIFMHKNLNYIGINTDFTFAQDINWLKFVITSYMEME